MSEMEFACGIAALTKGKQANARQHVAERVQAVAGRRESSSRQCKLPSVVDYSKQIVPEVVLTQLEH